MEIDKVSEKLLSIAFLKVRKDKNDIVLIKNLKTALISINSVRCENVSLEKSDDLTTWLHFNNQSLLKKWNSLVDSTTNGILPAVRRKLMQLVDAGELDEGMLSQIEFDFISIAVYLTLKKLDSNFTSQFYKDLLSMYEDGYIPFGMSGGIYKVF